MPILKINSIGKEQAWALWYIDETEAALSFFAQESCPEEIVNQQKRLEWLAVRALMKSVTAEFGLPYSGLRKDEFGKPFLKEHSHQISLSHSFPYVAVQLARHYPVGIDLEQPKEKLRIIAPRVFNPEEIKDAGDDVVKLCIYWCAKEALYKIYGKRNLLFTDHLRVMPFNLSQSGNINGKIILPNLETTVCLQYLVKEDFALVYTALQTTE